MSEVVVPPGTLEPVFGLQIFNETPVFLDQLPDGTVTVDATGVGDVTIIAEDPFSTTPYFIVADGDDFIVTAAGDDEIYAGIGDDTVFGGLGDDVIFGQQGDDNLFGGAGDDTIYGGDGDDQIRGGNGNDLLFGGRGNDTMVGGAGNDTMRGGDGDDVMIGGSGNDLIIAGRGNDTLTGSGGADRFRFVRGSNRELDKVTDFRPGEDVIELSRALLPGARLRNGALNSSDFEVVDKIGATTAKIVYESSTGLVYYNPGRSGSEPVPLLDLGKNLNVASDSFRIIG